MLLHGLSLLLISCARQIPEQEQPAAFKDFPKTMVIAHRGGALLKPENTMPAFEHARNIGAHALELDIHLSKDQELVVIHDFSVNRTTQGLGFVADMTLAELKALDAGYNFSPLNQPEKYPYRGQGLEIPTLEEVLQHFPDMPLCIEIKPDNTRIVDKLADLLQKYKRVQQTMVCSFQHNVLDQTRHILPEVATGASVREVRTTYMLYRFFLGWLYTPQADALQIPEKYRFVTLASPGFIEKARDKGLLVHVWTVNEAENMRKYLDLGVDGIITDRPDLLLRILEQVQLDS